MINEVETKSPYISLEFCFYNQNFEKIDINRRGLGITGDIINYSMVSISAGSTELLESYMKNQGIDKNIAKFYKSKVVGNFGLYSYLFKKVEGKDNERAIQEVVFESVATELGSIATKTATRFGITMAGRILGGVAGSVIPSVGTIIGAVVGAWIAGKIEEWWFNENSLESSQIDNEKLTQLEQAYFTKINAINDYLTKNNYKELRILNESEAENLCKEASNLQSHYFKTIELMLSYKDYLSNQQSKSHTTDSTPTQSNTDSTTKSPKATKETTDSKTLTPNNNNQTPNTSPFSIQIKDYNTFTPLSNKQIQITNIDSKQRGGFFKTEFVNDSSYKPQAFNLAGEVRIICANALNISNAKNLSIAFLNHKYKIQNFLAMFYFYCIAIFLCFSTPLLAGSDSLILNPMKAEYFAKGQECDITKKGNICEITFRMPLDLWRVWVKNNQHIDIVLYLYPETRDYRNNFSLAADKKLRFTTLPIQSASDFISRLYEVWNPNKVYYHWTPEHLKAI